jgi:polyhydroxybutyrate depolymerase
VRTIVMSLAFLLGLSPVAAFAAELPPGGTFTDDDGSVHEADIEGLAASGITSGCSETRFCPDSPVTRGQMAAFLHRGLDDSLTPGEPVEFTDDDASVFQSDIEWLAAVGVTTGCGPGLFCPDDVVTRGQMAAFLVRALDLPPAAGAPFTDTGGVFSDDITRLAAAGITSGCSPTRFCPDDVVTRAQMASFLVRALGLTPIAPPPPPGSNGCGATPPESGTYSVTLGSETRTYLLDIPDAYDAEVRYPLVYGFHGAGGSASDFRVYSRLLTTFGDEAIIVNPDAGPTRRWLATNDLQFFDTIHELVTDAACVDPSSVFSTGHSSGGFMSNALGCRRGELIRAIAPVAGGGPFALPCDGPVAAWITHATNDPIVPFASGVASRDHWVEINGCDPDEIEDLDRGVRYTDCSSGAPVVWVSQGLLHVWPSWSAAEMWAFFEALP